MSRRETVIQEFELAGLAYFSALENYVRKGLERHASVCQCFRLSSDGHASTPKEDLEGYAKTVAETDAAEMVDALRLRFESLRTEVMRVIVEERGPKKEG